MIVKLGKKIGIFAAAILTSIIAGAFGGSQTLAVMLTYQLIRNMYNSADADKYMLAVDLEDTAIVISALIPWNIAGAVPAEELTEGSSYILYSFFLYLIPLVNLIMRRFKVDNRHKIT